MTPGPGKGPLTDRRFQGVRGAREDLLGAQKDLAPRCLGDPGSMASGWRQVIRSSHIHPISVHATNRDVPHVILISRGQEGWRCPQYPADRHGNPLVMCRSGLKPRGNCPTRVTPASLANVAYGTDDCWVHIVSPKSTSLPRPKNRSSCEPHSRTRCHGPLVRPVEVNARSGPDTTRCISPHNA